jgi:hypothetical protein
MSELELLVMAYALILSWPVKEETAHPDDLGELAGQAAGATGASGAEAAYVFYQEGDA